MLGRAARPVTGQRRRADDLGPRGGNGLVAEEGAVADHDTYCAGSCMQVEAEVCCNHGLRGRL